MQLSLEAGTGEPIFADNNCILVPLVEGSDQVLGLLQINKDLNNDLNGDEEYLILYLTVFCKAILKQILIIDDLRQENKLLKTPQNEFNYN